jgi:hypothetical protein
MATAQLDTHVSLPIAAVINWCVDRDHIRADQPSVAIAQILYHPKPHLLLEVRQQPARGTAMLDTSNLDSLASGARTQCRFSDPTREAIRATARGSATPGM